MEWWLILIAIFGAFFVLMFMGMPVAFAFLLVNSVAALLLWQGTAGLVLVIGSIKASICRFSLVPLPLFILMGTVIFESGMAPLMLDTFDKWLGRLPGRLALVAIGTGTLFGTLSGSGMASCAMLGTTLVPEMEKRGYKKAMTLGPVLGSSGLAMMIPPSNMTILMAAFTDVAVGKALIAIVVPGLMMAVLYAAYTVTRCLFQPFLAPSYEVLPTPLLRKVSDTAKYILPFGIIIFLVTGVIFLGIATPTEAAATGALGTLILVACYRRMTWAVIKKSLTEAVRIAAMMWLILAAAQVFSQVLAYSEASKGMIELVLSLPLAPIMIIIAIQIFILTLGTVMSSFAIIMIIIPIVMPIVHALGFDPLWFTVLLILDVEMSSVSPPFGMNLFVMKGVAPPDTAMRDIYTSVLPYIGCDAIVLALMLAFPIIPLFLPRMMM